MTKARPSLASLARGFRSSYLSWTDIEAQLRAWADAYPEIAHLESIGKTKEGRELWVLTLGRDPLRVRPAVWIDGNMHASELCGSSVALGIAEDILALHLNATTEHVRELPAHTLATLENVLFHIMPRISPDGAEAVLTTGKYVRSVPRDRRPNKNHAYFTAYDVDGDGEALLMRVQDPTGEYVESKNEKDLMLLRRLEDEGPFYKIYPEGLIENFDGSHVPSPTFLSDNDTDLNRNFPHSWLPEPEQVGAGRFALSEPESRAVVEFTSARPHIFAWLNLHTFGGVFIRPLGDKPDTKMNPEDLALFREIGRWNEKLTGYPTVSGFEEFTYEPDKPLHGDLSDYAYVQRGCIAYVCELWDLFRQIGMEKHKRFVDHYTHMTREDLERLAKWDREKNRGRTVRPWRAFKHPQLGEVELGGIDSRVGLWNPPYEMLDEICRAQSAAFLRVAALAPRLIIADITQAKLGEQITEVTLTVRNDGYLPTYVLASSKALAWNEPLYATLTRRTPTLSIHPGDARRELGHLDGWGRGQFGEGNSIFFQRSRGSTASRTVRLQVKGRGPLRLSIGSCRVGYVETEIEIS
ncbi:MAG: peptidase M14 [Sandaracinaceae bacterium]|nr:peptidase M14 [Sandaracinaceae bacterium]